MWVDKFKSKKPHYFIRILVGYEWNSYNKVHYSLDNPPPKHVMGYRFNIFYPDRLN